MMLLCGWWGLRSGRLGVDVRMQVWKVRYSRLNYCVLCGGIILYTGAFGRCSCSALPAHRVAVVITNRCGSSVGLRALRSRARRATAAYTTTAKGSSAASRRRETAAYMHRRKVSAKHLESVTSIRDVHSFLTEFEDDVRDIVNRSPIA